MAEMEALSQVQLTTQPAMGLAGSERSLRKHGDLSFEVSDTSPCRPDTFATAEADAESGTTGGDEVLAAIRRIKTGSSGTAAEPGADSSANQDGVAGVMSA